MLTTKLTNRIVGAAVAAIEESLLQLPPANNSKCWFMRITTVDIKGKDQDIIMDKKFITMSKSNQMNNRILKSNEYQKFHNQSLYKLIT